VVPPQRALPTASPPLSFPIQNPSTKLRPRWSSCLRERVEISIHNPSHKQQSSVHIFPAKAPSLLHQAPSTAIHTQIICLQTDTISSSAHKRREKQQRCPQIYLEIPYETCVPPIRLTSALKVPEQAQFICLHDSRSISARASQLSVASPALKQGPFHSSCPLPW